MMRISLVLSNRHTMHSLINLPHVESISYSPHINVFYRQHSIRLTLDTGATTNVIRATFAKAINLPLTPASQLARQADGVTPLHVIGEVYSELTRGQHTFKLDALVVEQLDVDVLAGNPFLALNDIATRPAKRHIVINGSEIIQYGPKTHRHEVARRI